jgi:tight adherence protein B
VSIAAIVAVAVLAVSVFTLIYLLLAYKPEAQVTGDIFLQMQKSDSAITASTVGMADRMLSFSVREKVAAKLSVAGVRIRPAEWLVLQFSVALILGVSGALLLSIGWGVAGFLLGPLVLHLWLSLKVSQVRRKFEETLADTLQLVAGSLRSGLSLAASLGVVANEGRGPIQSEISRVLSKARLGIPVEDALDEVAERMKSQDFSWVALSVRIQKEVGGNLAEVLTTTAETIRERAYLHRQVRSLSAEGRLSAYILFALPLLVGAWMVATRYDYISVMWTTKIGSAMSVVTAVLMIVGLFWMKKTAKVEV